MVFNGYRVSALQDENEVCGWMVAMAAMVKRVKLMHSSPQLKKNKNVSISSVEPPRIFRLLLPSSRIHCLHESHSVSRH